MDKVFLVFEIFSYSEEDHDSDVIRVFRSKDDADFFCSFMNDNKKDSSYSYFVVSFKVF